MLSIGARLLQLHFGARDELHGNLWFWIIGSGELDFKNLINLSDVNKDFRLSIKQSIDEDHQKIWFRESVNPIQVPFNISTPFDDLKYFKIEVGSEYYFDFMHRRGAYDRTMKILPDIHTLILNGNAKIILTRLKIPINLHSLKLKNGGYSQKNMAPLGMFSLYTLELNNINKFEDVSNLGGVHTLKLQHLDVKDVHALSNIHTLNLQNLTVTDVSKLGSVHNLSLIDLYKVTDVSDLHSVHTLKLKELNGMGDSNFNDEVYYNSYNSNYIDGLDDTGALENVTNGNYNVDEVDYNPNYYDGVDDVSNLGNVHTLTLEMLRGVRDVSNLGNVHTLTLDNLP